MSISSNIERIKNEIADACSRAYRNPETVALLAVSKVQPAEAIHEALSAGQRMFGENRVQEWQSKRETLAQLMAPSQALPNVHLIGPLQNNKTARAAEIFDSVDTLDSLKTAQRLDAAAQSYGKTVSAFIEVKLSHEDSKHGIDPTHLTALLDSLKPLHNLEIRGLMTVPPFHVDPERARPYFRELRRLRDENQAQYSNLTELSMGMSNDFVVAIEEGSTTVRIGTAIFGKRIRM